MRILFNKSANGAQELKELTGSYYANNAFDKIKTELLLETEKVIDLIGEAIYTRAETHYYSNRYQSRDQGNPQTDLEKLNDDLVQHIQLPIALSASIKFYQSNLVSHEDAGRKVKLDETKEKMAWEWMIDRDDDAHTRKAFATQDRLIRFLDKKEMLEWKDSPQKTATRELFINTTEAFNDVYPIDNSPRFFYGSLPFNKEVQRNIIKKALGEQYADLLLYFQQPVEIDETKERLLALVKAAIPVHVMILAIKRFSVQVLPEGVVQQFKSISESRNASQPPAAEIIRIFTNNLERDAARALDDLKREIKILDPEAQQYQYLPKNDPANTYFRT